MKPFIHAKNSVSKYGGSTIDYMDIHDFMDSSKSSLPDHRHRVILHSSFGIYIVEKVFGAVRTNSDGKEYSVRDVAEDHVYEDLGFIPTLENWLEDLPIQDWMGGSERDKGKDKNVPRKIPVKVKPLPKPEGIKPEDILTDPNQPISWTIRPPKWLDDLTPYKPDPWRTIVTD